MKKILFLLLLSVAMYGQVPADATPLENVQITNNVENTTPAFIGVQEVNGVINKIPSAYIEKTENKQNSLAIDGTGTKYPTVDAVNAALPRNYTKVVYVNSTTPSTATIFDDENPPVVNDDLLKSDVANLYIGTDVSPWVWNGSTYETKVVPASSNFYLSGTTVDAGNSKIEPIERSGVIKSGGLVTDGVYANAINVAFETPNTIASFDAGKQLRSLSTDTYPSLTELSYVKGVTSGFQAQINGKADLDGSGKVPLSQINDALLGSVNYKGTYNATTNVPAIPTATSSNKGWYYIISTAGTQQGYNFVNGDWIISNGTSWGKVDNNNTVTSVNSQVGAVSVTASSIGAQTTLTNPTTGVGSQNDPNAYALQDGTILYHSVKWFIPTSTVSTSGTTVTSVGTQFTSLMVGAKLTINGEFRIITGYTSSTVVTVASAYSTDYSGIVAGNWGVYSKFIDTKGQGPYSSSTYNFSDFYGFQGVKAFIIDGNTFSIDVIRGSSNNVNYNTNQAIFGGNRQIVWTNNVGGVNEVGGTNDLGLRRNTAGVLEIYDGVTADGAIGNRRDLLARNITATNYTGSATLTGEPTAPTAAAGTNTTQIATTAFVQAAITNNGIITTSANITNATPTDSGLPQNGKTLYISNGATNINYTVNGGITASFVKGGTGSITFVQGSGRTTVAANGTLVFNGAQYSTASIVSFGTTDIVYINNF